MTPADEASEILIRLFNTIIAPMGKRLGEVHKTEIRRACQLLSADGTLSPLEDMPPMPRVSPAEAVMELAANDPGYKRWKEEREKR